MNLPIHPLAEIFPPMSDAEFQALKADIYAHGQHELIWTYKGQIIDGRHRYRAMTELGLGPLTREYEFEDVLEFVMSMNLHRRHLDPSQRAAVASKLADMGQGQRTDLQPSANLQKVSQADAAKLMNVSTRSVAEASKILKIDPDLAQVVAAGGVSIHAASKVAGLPPAQRQEVVAAGPAAIKKAAKAIAAESALHEPGILSQDEAEREAQDAYTRLIEDNEMMGKVFDADDKLSAAMAELKRATEENRVLRERLNGLMNEKNAAVQQAKIWRSKCEKLEKAAA